MNKDRDIPRNGDVWVYFEGGQYKIIDIAKDVDTNEDLVICHKVPIDEECSVLAYKLKDFMQPITAEQNDLLSKCSFYKKHPKLKPKYKFNLSHCGISLFCEKKRENLINVLIAKDMEILTNKKKRYKLYDRNRNTA